MAFLSRLLHSTFIIRLRSWEYWPFGIIQAPLFPYWLWLSLRARSLIYWSASNPGIVMGGMFGESKFDVLEKIPEVYKPKAVLVRVPALAEQVKRQIEQIGIGFPLIFKPDLGERGWMVKKISNPSELENYLAQIKIDFIAQEFVDLPLEFGVFYVRYPSEQFGRVTSIAGKEMLSVVGDGIKTLRELILKTDRAKLQWKTLSTTYKDDLERVIPLGERRELVSIGNHCLGTRFLNANHLITEKLTASFERISKQIDGFYFGRFDLRVASLEDLENGKIMIMELNGCGAEPAHIYQSGFSLTKACGVLIRHWGDIYRVSRENHERGVAYLSFREARKIYRNFKTLTSS